MFVEHLQLKNFRNYQDLNLHFDHQINIFQGDNAQGKTNILEAIYVLALAKSHRTSKEKELVQWGQSFSVIKGTIQTRRNSLKLEMQLTSKGKKAKINQLEQRKLSDYIGAFNVIMFAPEDLTLVKGSPQYRRKFLDVEIGQVSPSYLYHLSQYQKIIQQRNNLLKDFTKNEKNKLELLEIWDQQLVEYGSKVISKRLYFLRHLEKWAKEIHAGITDQNEELSILYKPSFPLELGNIDVQDMSDQFTLRLQKIRKQELFRGTSLIGPHRDDLYFSINQIDVQSFGSQGQQRTTALSLKLAEIELIHDEIGEYPVLLLDDVLSELDQKRQTQLIQTIENKVQTMITTTSTEGININTLKRSSIFYVEQGLIS
ncbi:DNA replication/repair protein RecF [Tepidibacillus decaturensis]|uniref:DNA replication and repair protein RecF n=1 Tax=Tepidibacillus decaturensis TaxID=1413211 RepID=A0A135L715_9BACI|nr:DNA replication/repair protein RecF [Tepidibacillus decaturensis]KXG44795.1 DNA replication/repair protein RecF [Tepidibacillus decaturensis]